jgi:hypothetical protein
MSMNHIRAAFEEVCTKAVVAESHYVSLYVDLPYYGGPEEGGWWGTDTELIAFQEVSSEAEAKAIKDQVLKLAEQLNEDARRRYYEDCARSVEWVEEHDPMAEVGDYFPEPDGDEKYWVAVETNPGSMKSTGSRYYE